MSIFQRVLISVVMAVLPVLFVNCSSSSSNSDTAATGQPVGSVENVVTKGSRTLGVDIVDESTASTFIQNVTYAKAIGAEYFILDMLWSQIESGGNAASCAAGTYVDMGSRLAILNSTLPTVDIKVTINFNLSTTNIWGLPSVFSPSDFTADSSLTATQNKIDIIACRYVNALNYVFSQIPNVKVSSLQIGNEIDYLPQATNANFWANYWRFLASATSYARTIRTTSITSALPVGVTASLSGLTGGKGEVIRLGLNALNANISDFVAANFYPFEAGGSSA